MAAVTIRNTISAYTAHTTAVHMSNTPTIYHAMQNPNAVIWRAILAAGLSLPAFAVVPRAV